MTVTSRTMQDEELNAPSSGAGWESQFSEVISRDDSASTCETASVPMEGSSDEPAIHQDMMERWFHQVFSKAKGERFEDGMESGFSRQLEAAIRQYSGQAICEIDHLIGSPECDAEVASEALRWMGLLSHQGTHKYRLWLLKKNLSSASPRIRDGALLALSFLDDPAAIDCVREAVKKESHAELKLDMERVLQQLEDTRRCQST